MGGPAAGERGSPLSLHGSGQVLQILLPLFAKLYVRGFQTGMTHIADVAVAFGKGYKV